LLRLRELGQSVWYDNIERGLLVSGALQRLIDNDGVAGVTSNPTIFQKAVEGSVAYDHVIADLAGMGLSTAEIVQTVVTQDIGMAADLLRACWETTGHVDGWISIEVAPSLAFDTEGTVAEVHRLRRLVDRPNVLVKIPATKEGVAAIRQCVGEGISINVTLIFALARYREVMEAYIGGLETLVARRASGEDLPAPGDVHGVASFFVSRVDNKIDAQLAALIAARPAGDPEAERLGTLRGKAAVANAKVAYAEFQATFAGARWAALVEQGANLQRPLWASTSTKNPEYRDVLYVEELIGAHTVNTIPDATLIAFRDHGVVAETLTAGLDEARRQLDDLGAAGISLDEVTAALEAEGVRAFADSFDTLFAAVDAKRHALGSDAPR
jgi:transaldolase